VIPDQIIDHTYGRKFTYFEDTEEPITHIDFTEPYCARTREYIIKAAELENEEIIDGGVYAAMQGPRLETVAEINKLEREGADMVGMTGMPETALAKELGLHYAAIAVVANYAAGRGASKHAIRLEDVHAVLDHSMINVRKIIERVVELNGD
jgi:5'-methylthioadenosine phosphorylase